MIDQHQSGLFLAVHETAHKVQMSVRWSGEMLNSPAIESDLGS